MSHSQAVVAKTMASVEKARIELNALKSHLHTLSSPPPALLRRVAIAEQLEEKAERKVLLIKSVGRATKRHNAYVPRSIRAKRALTVLQGGTKRKFGGGKGVKDEELNALLKRISKETGLMAGRVSKSHGGGVGVGFECRNVFRAYLWFKDSSPWLIPEHIAVFRVDELHASRFSCSRHAIFNVLTERANAAVRYWGGGDVLMPLAKWLAKHDGVFGGKCEERRLAFDASRGMFLPPCVIGFGGGDAAFTRGTIPVRSQGGGGVRMGKTDRRQTQAGRHGG